MISIIVPVFNAEFFIEKCVLSVQKQSIPDWELLLVNDGSTDRSGEICEALAVSDRRIHVYHKENGGVSSARNLGIEKAKGAYIAFLDADDELLECACEIMLNVQAETNCDIVSGKTKNDTFPWNCKDDSFCWKGEEGIVNSLKDSPEGYSCWGKLYTREIIGETRFREDIRYNEDSLFVFQLMCKLPKFVGICNEVYVYNFNPASATQAAFSDNFLQIPQVADAKYEIICRNYPHLLMYAENAKLKSQMALLRILAARTNKERRILEKTLIKDICRNRRFYISGTSKDDQWMRIIVLRLYFLYKKLLHLKRRITQ